MKYRCRFCSYRVWWWQPRVWTGEHQRWHRECWEKWPLTVLAAKKTNGDVDPWDDDSFHEFKKTIMR